MRRIIFFILIVLVIGATSCLLVFGIPGGVLDAPEATSLESLEVVFNKVKDNSWQWSEFSTYTVFTYGYVFFLFISSVLLLTLLVMALTTLFKFSKIHRFYAVKWWYLFAALVFTGVNVYLMIDAGGNFLTQVQALAWQFYLPIGTAVVLVILGIILKVTARKKKKK